MHATIKSIVMPVHTYKVATVGYTYTYSDFLENKFKWANPYIQKYRTELLTDC